MVRRCCIPLLLPCLQLTLAGTSTSSPVSSSDTDPGGDHDDRQHPEQVIHFILGAVTKAELKEGPSWLSSLFGSRELRSERDRDNLFWATRGKREAGEDVEDFWAIRGKKQSIKPNGFFQHFENQRDLRTPGTKRAGLKPNGLFSSIKRGLIKPNGLFNAYKRGGLKPNGLFGAYKRLKPNGLFGAFKRSSMRPNGLFNAYKRAIKPNGLFSTFKRPSLKPNGLF